jgi:hypothetical protein
MAPRREPLTDSASLPQATSVPRSLIQADSEMREKTSIRLSAELLAGTSRTGHQRRRPVRVALGRLWRAPHNGLSSRRCILVGVVADAGVSR